MSANTLEATVVEESAQSPDWVIALDSRGAFLTVFLALAATVAVVVVTSAVLQLLAGN